jgi:hypothetical protein
MLIHDNEVDEPLITSQKHILISTKNCLEQPSWGKRKAKATVLSLCFLLKIIWSDQITKNSQLSKVFFFI